MVTVEADVDGVEARLRVGALVCPGCSGVLAGWVGPGPGPVGPRPGGFGVDHSAAVPVRWLRGDSCAVAGAGAGSPGGCRGGDRAGAGGEGCWWGVSADRCCAGAPSGDGAGLVAPFWRAGGGGACGVHLVVPGAGGGSGAARAGGHWLGSLMPLATSRRLAANEARQRGILRGSILSASLLGPLPGACAGRRYPRRRESASASSMAAGTRWPVPGKSLSPLSSAPPRHLGAYPARDEARYALRSSVEHRSGTPTRAISSLQLGMSSYTRRRRPSASAAVRAG